MERVASFRDTTNKTHPLFYPGIFPRVKPILTCNKSLWLEGEVIVLHPRPLGIITLGGMLVPIGVPASPVR
jgi:hypothetical protein